MDGVDPGGIFGVGKDDAGELLEGLDRVVQKTRGARHSYWFPLFLFGLIILGALPFYRPVFNPHAGTGPFVEVFQSSHSLDRLGLGGLPGSHLWGAAFFWLVAVPLAYVAVAMYYIARSRRTGLQSRIWPFAVGGIALFGLLLATAPGVVALFHPPEWLVAWQTGLGDLYIRGLTPVLIIALGFFVLARMERSWALFWISFVFLIVAFLANLYNISNAFYRIWTPYKPHHWIVPDWAANLAVAGGFLVFVGLVSGLVARRRSS
jgi:hypothetical protein